MFAKTQIGRWPSVNLFDFFEFTSPRTDKGL
jgi:hypothetical protein